MPNINEQRQQLKCEVEMTLKEYNSYQIMRNECSVIIYSPLCYSNPLYLSFWVEFLNSFLYTLEVNEDWEKAE